VLPTHVYVTFSEPKAAKFARNVIKHGFHPPPRGCCSKAEKPQLLGEAMVVTECKEPEDMIWEN